MIIQFKKPDKKPTFVKINLKKEQMIVPNIEITSDSIRWMRALVECHETEVGWLGLVEEDVNENGIIVYVVTKIVYPKHYALHGTTCEINSSDALKLMLDIPDSIEEMDRMASELGLQDYFNPDMEASWLQGNVDKAAAKSDVLMSLHPDLERVNSSMRIWGHSHVNMSVAPSGQDDMQGESKASALGGIFIRVICNKSMDMSVSVYDASRDVRFDHVPWKLRMDENDSAVATAIKSKLASFKRTMKNIDEEDLANEFTNMLHDKIIKKTKDQRYEDIKTKVEALKIRNAPAAPQTQGYTVANKVDFSTFPGNNDNWSNKHSEQFSRGYPGQWDEPFVRQWEESSVFTKKEDAINKMEQVGFVVEGGVTPNEGDDGKMYDAYLVNQTEDSMTFESEIKVG